MRVTDTRVSNGDVVSLGEVHDAHTEMPQGGGLRVIVAHSGESTEYVVLRLDASDGTDVNVPQHATVLSVESGRGLIDASVWVLVPRDAYGGGSE